MSWKSHKRDHHIRGRDGRHEPADRNGLHQPAQARHLRTKPDRTKGGFSSAANVAEVTAAPSRAPPCSFGRASLTSTRRGRGQKGSGAGKTCTCKKGPAKRPQPHRPIIDPAKISNFSSGMAASEARLSRAKVLCSKLKKEPASNLFVTRRPGPPWEEWR